VLHVPLVPQTNPGGRNSCVPACVSMVLAFQGVAVSEETLCDALGTQSTGTEVWNVLSLDQHVAGCQVELGSMSVERLQESLVAGIPPIAFVVTGRLHYWQRATLHAVVVVEVTVEELLFVDPAFAEKVRAVPLAEFVAAWSELDFLAAVVTVRPAGG
jgi:ABC-type bacteriocin/lantibiotic exporter with double-glycine peptidase domain